MLALLCGAALAAPYLPEEVPSPRDRGSWVADLAQVLEPAQEAAIDARVDALRAELGAEVAVVTVGAVQGTPKEFAGALFERWGVGAAEANNGVLVLLVVDARRVEIETGYGVEAVLTDGWLGRMMDERMVPRFQAGALGEGLVAGVVAIDERLRERPEETREGNGGIVSGPARPEAGVDPDTVVAVAAGGGAVLVGGGLFAGLVVVGRRRRQCPVCRQEMELLDEEADDAHLDEGQQHEERLRAVDYEVRVCRAHEQVRIIPHGRWFSGFVRCRRCGYRTSRRDHQTLVHATYTHGGEVRVSEHCDHCGFRHSSTYRTPRKVRASAGSGRSGGGFGGSGGGFGGGFGGGRSGGGGAGRSW